MLDLIHCRHKRDSFTSLGQIRLKMDNDESFELAMEDEQTNHDYEPHGIIDQTFLIYFLRVLHFLFLGNRKL
jgi:hypothetical protein